MGKLHLLPPVERAIRETEKRDELTRRREVLIAAIDQACSASGLTEDDISAALLITSHRRAQEEARVKTSRG
jgi:hypothetical protein